MADGFSDEQLKLAQAVYRQTREAIPLPMWAEAPEDTRLPAPARRRDDEPADPREGRSKAVWREPEPPAEPMQPKDGTWLELDE